MANRTQGQEVDLLVNYPRTRRNVEERGAEKTEADRALARQFGKDFFDGDRKVGYGGFGYNSRFWEPVIPTFQAHFGLSASSSLLDVGCAKGFMLYDLGRMIPGITLAGIDISEYAISHCKEEVRELLAVGDARQLPFPDNSFDVVIAITTLHNLEKEELAVALQEIERVKKGGSFITVDAYRDELERKRMEAWNLTARTVMHVEEWKAFFNEVGYTGDYFWFIP